MKEKFKRGKRTKDLTGKVFGKLTVLEFAGYKVEKSGKSMAYWLCKCSCGSFMITRASSLKSRHHTRSCGKCNFVKIKIGDTFGKLTVLAPAKYIFRKNGWRVPQWLCKCACGKEKTVRECDLKSGNTKSCGNCNIVEVGDRFGKLKVLSFKGYKYKNKSNYAQWLCKCDCGNEVVKYAKYLLNGDTKSCGCLSKQPNGGFSKKYNLQYDSSWELNFVKILEYLEIKWQREPKKFKLSNKKVYTPDFYLPEFNMFIEIKGHWFPDKNGFSISKEKTELFQKEYLQYNYYVIDEFKYKEIENHFKFLLK